MSRNTILNVHKLIPALLAVVFSASPLCADELIAAVSVEELETRIREILKETNSPGMIGAIVTEDGVIWQGAVGLADRRNNRPVTKDTVFRVGSISKSFVSLAALILKERGLLTFDMEINKAVPQADISNPWESDNPVRLVHVLEHTAGFDDLHLHDYSFGDPDATTLEGIQMYTASIRKVRWPPGTRMAYSNIGPLIGALLIEKVTGKSFEDVVQQEIFNPLGMSTATFFYDKAVSKSYGADGETEMPYMHIGGRASGSMGATSHDMIQLLKMFLNRGAFDGGILLPPRALTRMETAVSTLAAKQGLQVGYGLGNSVSLKDRFVYHGHTGAIDGFISKYAYLPAHKRAYFFSLNASNFEATRLIDNELHAFVTSRLEPSPQQARIKLTTEQLQVFAGYYQPDAPRQEILRGISILSSTKRIRQDDGKLIISSLFGEDEAWSPVSENLFIKGENALASLAFVETERGEKLAQELGPLGSIKKISSFYAISRWVLTAGVLILMLSSCLFAVVWGVRKLLGRLPHVHYLRVRALPLLTTLSFIGSVLFLAVGINSPAGVPGLGVMNIWTVGYWLLSWLFALLAIISFLTVWQYRSRINDIGKAVWVHSLMVAVATILTTAFFTWYGILGLRPWAY
ncbi:MAG: serine hydrolase [Gammaproteobacteria bacterium]|nr:serine hydrolase [Gammaproteobacteria bacterium]